MTTSDDSLFDRVAAEMAAHLDGDSSGHDLHHARRVNRLGVRIAEAEGADPRVVGVARAFQFGGAHGNRLWDPDRPLPGRDDAYRKDGHDDHDGPASTYHHFHAKLLRLHENMNTEAGREIAAGRHAFLEEFAERFEQEWYGEA